MIKVLIADDQELIRESLKIVLSANEDIEVTGTAENGEEVLSEIKKEKPDVILMDIRMPVLDGIGAARQIRALDREDVKDLPIIAMTANAGDEDRRQTKEAGMNEHLAKPIDPKLLYATLQKYILS